MPETMRSVAASYLESINYDGTGATLRWSLEEGRYKKLQVGTEQGGDEPQGLG
jgi:hypothetical protein